MKTSPDTVGAALFYRGVVSVAGPVVTPGSRLPTPPLDDDPADDGGVVLVLGAPDPPDGVREAPGVPVVLV